MGTEVALFGGNLPAHLKARAAELSETAKALMGSGGGGKRISMKNGVWRLLDNGKEIAQVEERYLDIVIVKAAAKVSRVFYGEKYDSDNPAPPKCWSADGEKPDASIKEPQFSTCANCEQNVAGSGQGNSRACRFQQRIAAVTAGSLVEHGAKADVLNFTVPATSLFGKADGDKRPLQEYARFLGAQKISPDMVITRMKFDTSDDVEGQKVVFKAMRYLEQDEFEAVEELAASPDADKAITMTVAQVDSVKSKDAVGGAAPKRTKKTEEEDEAPAKPKASRTKAKPKDEDEDEAPPPAKTKAKAPAEDDEDEAPPPAKSKAKAAAEEDEDDAPPPAKRASAKESGASDGAKKSAAQLAAEWDD